jgi:cell division protein FtsQ
MWKKRIIQALWITLGVVTVVLLGAAMQQKNHKVCSDVKIEISGAEEHMFMDEKDILQIINASGNVVGKDISSISSQQMEDELEVNPWVKNAELFFDNNQVLQVSIQERQPIARIFTTQGSSFYLDTAAVQLPLSEKLTARVPIFTNFPSDKKVLAKGDSLVMQQVIQLGKFIMADSFWMAQIAQVDVTPSATFEMIPVVGNHIVSLGDASDLENKFNRLYTFYKKAWVQNGLNKYEKLDVRYNNQVVAIKSGMSAFRVDSAKATQLANNLVVPSADSLMNTIQPNEPKRNRDTVRTRTATTIVKPVQISSNNKPIQNKPKPIVVPKTNTGNNKQPKAVMNGGN